MKIINLLIIQIIIGIFICNCSNQVNMLENKSVPTNQPSNSAIPTIFPSINFVDKNNLQSPTCQNPNVITGNIYSNNKGVVNYSDDLKDYLEALKDEVPLEIVEITYNNKILKSNARGVFSLPKSDIKENTKFKFSKQGYIPFETFVSDNCLLHIGLSPLYENELTAKDIKFRGKFGISSTFRELPESFTLIKQDSQQPYKLGYIIIDNSEKAKKINLGEFQDKEMVIENIDFNKEMEIILSDGQEFGTNLAIVDTVMESDRNLILSSHKGINKTLLPKHGSGPSGDSFAIQIQTIIVPKSDKEIILNLSKEIKINLLK
ncbi:MAG: hypothetical protein H7263_16340 [Candidatus Sericytochromatia bacterium]|nr:hypothetical protein [Candidatus Sericytochromatia bacterium]